MIGAPPPAALRPVARRVLNARLARPWSKIAAARYVAVQVIGEGDVYQCRTRGAGQWSAAQLELWALQMSVEVELVEWLPASMSMDIGGR